MIQLIVYTGFYWAVKVMESLLVVNSATACALPLPWISTLRGPRSRGETAGLGADCWCSQFMAVMSFLLPEKPHSASLGISAQLWRATVNKASGKGRGKAVRASMLAPAHILLDRHAEGGRARRPLEEEEECDGRKERQRWRWSCHGYNLEIILITSDFSL